MHDFKNHQGLTSEQLDRYWYERREQLCEKRSEYVISNEQLMRYKKEKDETFSYLKDDD